MLVRERSFWMLVTVVLGIIILYQHSCRRVAGKTEYVTTIKRDTIYEAVHDTTVWKVPVVRMETIHDTLTVPFIHPDNINMIPQFPPTAQSPRDLWIDHFTARYYEDTTHIQYGMIITRDTVYTNRIIAHQVEHRLNIPTIREVVTITEKPRTQMYIGLGMIGGKQDFLHAFEGTLSLKNKADQIYSIGAVMQTDGQLYYKGGVMFKISFKKKGR